MTGEQVKPAGEMIYQSPHISARFVAAGSERVVVCFPDRIHPLGPDHPGWGESFLTKRGISGIYIALSQTNWFQCPDFFDAMRACRQFLGPKALVTAYGGSMGGYGALLAAKTLEASLCVALSPQFSIDPGVVPFERRYLSFFQQTGPLIHDVSQEVSAKCHYILGYDPLHRRDRKHVLRYREYFPISELPIYCAGHGVLNLLKRFEGFDRLADVLIGRVQAGALRSHIRPRRQDSYRYLKKMGRLAKERGHGALFDYDAAMRRFKAPAVAREEEAVALEKKPSGPRPKLIIHCGLPKTGTSSLQAYFFTHADRYLAEGICYPTQHVDTRDLNHAWLSQNLREASVTLLRETLASVPETATTVLLSDESLFVELPALTPQARAALADVVAGYEVEVILLEREMTAWMRSFYLQSVQNRHSGRKYPHQTARDLWQTALGYEYFFAQPLCRKLLDFDTMRADLRDLFSANSVTVLPFEPGKDVVQVFCAAMNWPHFEGQGSLALNPSITDSQAEILRQANGLGNDVARFVKQMIELPGDYKAANLRAKRREMLEAIAENFPWAAFRFQENPPLDVTEESYQDAFDALREKALRLGTPVKK